MCSRLPQTTARFVHDADDTLRLLADGLPCPLVVKTPRGSWTYYISLTDAGCWEAAFARPDGEPLTWREAPAEFVAAIEAALTRLAGKAVAS